jgi:cobalt-zinc-cadmium efflux system outer membrane protein
MCMSIRPRMIGRGGVGSALFACLLAGCANVPPDAGFSDVESAIAQRTGKRVQWNRGTEADKHVEAAIRSMLGNELTADDAVQIALLNNQNLQATYEDLGVAQAELFEAGLLHNPTLNAEVRFPKHARLPIEFDVSQSFLDLLLLPIRKRAADSAFAATKLRVTHQVLNVAADVRLAFYRGQGSAQIVDMRRSIVAATDASFDAAKRLHDAGNITDLAFANEQALHEQAKVDLAKAQREALDAREDLSALMGVWGNQIEWTLAARLPELPGEDGVPMRFESVAVSQRADLGAARQEVDVAAQSLGLNGYTAMISDLQIGVHFEQDADGTTTAGPTVQIPLPLFNQGLPAIAAAKARLRQSERRYAALAIEIRSQVRRCRNRLTAARALAESYSKVILPLRHEIVRQTQLEYNAMGAGVFQLLQAKQGEIDAGREYVQALQDYWIARTELERALGGRLSAGSTTQPATSQSSETPPSQPEHQHQH